MRLCSGIHRPAPSASERKAGKQIARALLDTLKRKKLALDWRKQPRYRAAARLISQDVVKSNTNRQRPVRPLAVVFAASALTAAALASA